MQFCDNCGYPLKVASSGVSRPPGALGISAYQQPPASGRGLASVTCSACGAVNMPGETFCQNCGVQLAPVASTPPPPPVPVPSQGVGRGPVGPSAASGKPPTVCSGCGTVNQPGDAFCQNCGLQLAPQSPAPVPPPGVVRGAQGQSVPPPGSVNTPCSTCGYKNAPGERFCQNCGADLAVPVPPAAPSPPPLPSTPYRSAPVPAPSLCPTCGRAYSPGERFCQNCGADLAARPAALPPTPPARPASPRPEPVAGSPRPVPLDSSMPAAVPPVSVPQARVTCRVCGHENRPSDQFCQQCGAQLLPPPVPLSAAPPPAPVSAGYGAPVPASVPQDPSTVPMVDASAAGVSLGCLVVQTTRTSLPLPAGKEELLVGRQDPSSGVFPDIDLSGHGAESAGVSRRHARLVIESGQVFIEDLNSTNFTLVNKNRLLPGQRHLLQFGDEVRFGRLTAIYQKE